MGRVLVLVAMAAMVALALWRLAAASAADLVRQVRADGPLSLLDLGFEEALMGLCSVALVASGAWTILVTVLLLADVLLHAAGFESTGARAIRAVTVRMCPRLAHRIALAGCGVVLTAGLTSPATADDAVRHLEPIDLARLVGSRAGEPSPARVTVTTGESLWSIAKAALPDQAGNAEITAAWQGIHRANAHRIGDDPDLIFPGMTLKIPDLNALDRKDHQ